MPAAAMPKTEDGIDALHRLKSAEPPLYLTPSPELSKAARLASQHLFSSLNPFVPKSPFTHLLTEGFDAEQIWQQIDLQSLPLLSSLRRNIRNFEKNPEEIGKQFNFVNKVGKEENNGNANKGSEILEVENEDFDDDEDDSDEDDESENEDEDEDDSDDDGNGDEEKMEKSSGIEDRFLKIDELEEYLEDDEAKEYGLKDNKRKKGKVEDEDDEDDDEDEDEEDEFGDMGFDNSDEDGDEMANARYEDFFGGKKTGAGQKKKSSKSFGGSDNWDMEEELNNDNQKSRSLSTHEKEQEKIRADIENIEKANLEPKTWTMQGEITADKRPKNSALGVDLDFEHNVRPTPVITEEVTATLEELIKKRILEGQFDDVQRPPTLLNTAPREKVELDETKSKKGLAELYEDEYAQKTGLVSTALTFSDERKKEATMLFQHLSLKLDALTHFYFTPKPVINDMSIEANVPALAIEEVAPSAKSDADSLAPEEVYAGKGAVKEETELTKEERKRRRANKKRKFKAKNANQLAVKAQQSTLKKRSEEKEES